MPITISDCKCGLVPVVYLDDHIDRPIYIVIGCNRPDCETVDVVELSFTKAVKIWNKRNAQDQR